MNDNKLMIFTRNPVLRKVKTRLAATIGDQQALKIYCLLLEHTAQITRNIGANRLVYYADFVGNGDAWDDTYEKTIQRGADLGERMSNAFVEQLSTGAEQAVLIGSDCYELTSVIIQDAFLFLDQYDVVIGPALDGGYYLIGMKSVHKELFDGMVWSTASVLRETEARCNKLGLRYHLLPTLSDIDEEKDLLLTDILDRI
jgi:rSAM/selenodomain-associated transferase 1